MDHIAQRICSRLQIWHEFVPVHEIVALSEAVEGYDIGSKTRICHGHDDWPFPSIRFHALAKLGCQLADLCFKLGHIGFGKALAQWRLPNSMNVMLCGGKA